MLHDTPKTQSHGVRNNKRPVEPIGLCEGAPVLTATGFVPVENLRPGDWLLTSAGCQQITRRRHVTLVGRAVYVLAGTQGHKSLNRDSLLPAGQPVFVQDWRARALRRRPCALIPVASLIDGEFLRDLGQVPLSLIQLSFAQPCVLHGDGLQLACATETLAQRCLDY
ncbi:MAG: Hint domain-containing protein [Roseobacter sp.]